MLLKPSLTELTWNYGQNQIEEKRRMEAERREKLRLEEEKEEKRLSEERAHMQRQFEKEQEKERRKEIEVSFNSSLTNILACIGAAETFGMT